MELPGIFSYDIIFALFLGFFVLLGAHKGFEKMLKLVLVFVIPIIVLYYFGTTIHQYIPSLPAFDQTITALGVIIPSALLNIELIKYIFIEIVIYFLMVMVLSIIASFIKVKQKKALLSIKLAGWKKLVGAILSVILFYVFSFYLIFPLQLFGLNYQNSYIVEPMVENGVNYINVAPILKHKNRIEHDYISFNQVESSLLGNDVLLAYNDLVSIQNEIFTFELRFMDRVFPALRTNARDALLANKTFEDPINPYRGIGSALVKDQASLIFYDMLIALEQESTSIATVRSEYENALKYKGMIEFFYEELNGVIVLEYDIETDETIKFVIDSFITYHHDELSSNQVFSNQLLNINDAFTGYYLYGNLFNCAMNEAVSCELSLTPITMNPKEYKTYINQEILNHNYIDQVITFASTNFTTEALTVIELSTPHQSKLLKQKESFERYLSLYKELVDANEYHISFTNKVLMAMLNQIEFEEHISRSMMIRSIMNDLGSNFKNKKLISGDIYISTESFNITMATIDIIFHTEIWDSEAMMNMGDMERLIDKISYYVNNKIITPKYATILLNHFVYGEDNYHKSYFIDLIENGNISNEALQYFVNSNSIYISQELKDTISTYLP
jgi:hypothetical protein